MDMMRPNIELEIEELVLHGFGAIDRETLGLVVQQELVRLLADGGVPGGLGQGGEVSRLDGGTFNVAVGAKAEVVGTQIAQSIYGGLGS
jgi:hypothetical protein